MDDAIAEIRPKADPNAGHSLQAEDVLHVEQAIAASGEDARRIDATRYPQPVIEPEGGFTIEREDAVLQPLSLDSFAQVREYVSRYRVEYSLTDPQGKTLIDKQAVELRRGVLKFNPMIDVTRAERDAYIAEHRLPFHPLVARGDAETPALYLGVRRGE